MKTIRQIHSSAIVSLVLFAAWVVAMKTGSEPSSDWLGNIHTFVNNNLFGQSIMGSSSYNRFPLNTLFLYATHTTFSSKPYLAHAIMSGLIVYFFWLYYKIWKKIGGSEFIAAYLVLFVLFHRTFQLTISDLSCTHYLGAFIFCGLAINKLLENGRQAHLKACLILVLALLMSEVTILMLPFIMAMSSLQKQKIVTKQSLCFLVIPALYILMRVLAYTATTSASLSEGAYSVNFFDIPKNVIYLLKTMVLPIQSHGGKELLTNTNFILGTILLLAVFAAYFKIFIEKDYKENEQANTPLSQFKNSSLNQNKLYLAIWLAFIILPSLVFLAFDPQSKRLYLTNLIVLSLTLPLVLQTYVVNKKISIWMGVWLFVCGIIFVASMARRFENGQYYYSFISNVRATNDKTESENLEIIYDAPYGTTMDEGFTTAMSDKKTRKAAFDLETDKNVTITFAIKN